MKTYQQKLSEHRADEADEKERLFSAITKGYAFREAQTVWDANVAIEKLVASRRFQDAQPFRIGKYVCYYPYPDVDTNREIHSIITQTNI